MGKNRKVGKEAGSPGDRLFRIFLVLLSLVLVVMVIIAISVIQRESYHYISEPNDLLRMIRNGDYPDALTSMYDNIALGETPEKNGDYAVPSAKLEKKRTGSGCRTKPCRYGRRAQAHGRPGILRIGNRRALPRTVTGENRIRKDDCRLANGGLFLYENYR